jgi:hypothetical protein
MRRILLITETSDLAADLLVLAADARRIPLERFNQDSFPGQWSIRWPGNGAAEFRHGETVFSGAEISGAWFRRSLQPAAQQGAAGFAAREAAQFLGGVWATAPWFWMNEPLPTMRAEHKLWQLREAQRLGHAVPTTLVTNSTAAARDFAREGPVVAKTLAGGRLAVDGRDHAIFSTLVSASDMTEDRAIEAAPIIVQERIETQFDLRVTVIGDRVLAARIITADRTAQDLDWRRAEPGRLRYERHDLDDGLARRCSALVAAMGLTYGAIDFVVAPDGRPIFLELNPAGQWGWIEQATGLPITDAILDRLLEGRA